MSSTAMGLLEVKEKDGVRSRFDETAEVLTTCEIGGGAEGCEEVGMPVAPAPTPPDPLRPSRLSAETPLSLIALLLLLILSSFFLNWSLEALCGIDLESDPGT
jgi:hypothetical protein